MASNTENLNLLMKNPSTDGADTFNVQTMLNENWQKIDNNAGTVAQTLANILKPTTPPIIGLPPSTTPDGMFQALGNTGELHVWRKTVTTAQEIPAGYTLGDVIENQRICFSVSSSDTSTYFNRAKAIKVSADGKVSLDTSVGSWSGTPTIGLETLTVSDYFVSITGEPSGSDLVVGDVYYVPTGGSIILESNVFKMTKIQKVIGTPYIPAGTTTTYPVSTNPNAYQEGSDAKPAGYTLGEVVNTPFNVVNITSHSVNLHYASTVQVDGEGRIIDINTSAAQVFTISFSNPLPDTLKGKFVQVSNEDKLYAGAPISDGQIYYIPNDAIFSSGTVIDRYQPVTGYPAIPAGTIIEYLGKLGDKARVQVVSYVGTGTYGESNPCRLTFDFPPKVVMFLRGYKKGSTQFGNLTASHSDDNKIVTPESLVTTYTRYNGFGDPFGSYAKKSEDGKTIFWYNEQSSTQGNDTGYTYYFLAIG